MKRLGGGLVNTDDLSSSISYLKSFNICYRDKYMGNGCHELVVNTPKGGRVGLIDGGGASRKSVSLSHPEKPA